MKSPQVSIIILNWNGVDDTLECLESVYRIQHAGLSVIVVDNGSRDDSCREIRAHFPQVQLLENGANLGFAEGNNVGIRHAVMRGADFVFLLNNDTIVDPQIVTELLTAARLNGDMGIYGSKIYFHSEPDKIWYSGANWDDDDCQFVHSLADITEVAVTGYACGCAMFISRKTLEIIGLMDPVFFLTFEESDWCYRALRLGVKSYCVPTAKVWHKISASFGGSASPVITYFMTRNLLLWAERNLSRSGYRKVVSHTLRQLVLSSRHDGAGPARDIRYLSVLIVLGEHLLGRHRTPSARSSYLGLRDYLLRRFGNCPGEVTRLS